VIASAGIAVIDFPWGRTARDLLPPRELIRRLQLRYAKKSEKIRGCFAPLDVGGARVHDDSNIEWYFDIRNMLIDLGETTT
jgi:hypothetical protein